MEILVETDSTISLTSMRRVLSEEKTLIALVGHPPGEPPFFWPPMPVHELGSDEWGVSCKMHKDKRWKNLTIKGGLFTVVDRLCHEIEFVLP